MFSKTPTNKSTQNFLDNVSVLKEKINSCDAIVLGAGSGLSSSAGLTYSGERFTKNFQPFIQKYNLTNMYSAGFYPYPTLEEKWGYWCHHVDFNRYHEIHSPVYSNLLKILSDKNYFILTTNVDHCFIRSGFDKSKIFYTQGNYGLFQCSTPCHNQTYDNAEQIKAMLTHEKDTRIPADLVPHCPKCGAPMSMNLRADDTFVQDDGWNKASQNYQTFIKNHQSKNTLFLELGVGGNTPGIIKYPFWQMTYQNPSTFYATLNLENCPLPKELKARSLSITGDISQTINALL